MAVAIQDITQAAATTSSLVLGVSSGLARLFPLSTFGNAAQYTGTGTGAVTRTIRTKLEEIERSVIDYGADPTGVADSTTAFANAIANSRVIRVPAGTYKVTSLTLNRSVALIGDGRNATQINITTTTTHGITCIGESALGLGNVIRIEGIYFNYTGAGQAANCKGMLIQRKVMLQEVVLDGFTGDGYYFAPSNANPLTGTKGTIGNAVFFAYLLFARASNCGGDGCVVRMGANANTFVNCQFDHSGRYGFYHLTDGTDDGGATGSTYGNGLYGGQCAYNGMEGYRFASGTNIHMFACYAERNGWVGGNDYDPTATPYDFYFGDNVVRSWFDIGVLYGADTGTVRLPLAGTWGASSGGNTAQIQVWEGGRRGYGAT